MKKAAKKLAKWNSNGGQMASKMQPKSDLGGLGRPGVSSGCLGLPPACPRGVPDAKKTLKFIPGPAKMVLEAKGQGPVTKTLGPGSGSKCLGPDVRVKASSGGWGL